MSSSALLLHGIVKRYLKPLPEFSTLSNALSLWIQSLEETGFRLEDHTWVGELYPIKENAVAACIQCVENTHVAFWVPLCPTVISPDHVNALKATFTEYCAYLNASPNTMA